MSIADLMENIEGSMGMWCASFTNIYSHNRLRADISHCKTAEEAKTAAEKLMDNASIKE